MDILQNEFKRCTLYNMNTDNKKQKRLFLFAGYHPCGLIDSALVYYVQELSKHGDVIVVMDCDCNKTQLNKLKNITLFASGTRHHEYDFGSYKRGYLWAKENLNLSDYDYLYMVNDSVYGPFYSLDAYLKQMESCGCDAFGIVANPHNEHPHIQSWFIGITRKIFLSKWYDKFMNHITRHESKGQITKLYEQGFSALVKEHNLNWECLYSVSGRGVYNKVKKLYRKKMPFMKKVAFTRNHGGLGRQILHILNDTNKKLSNAILSSACAQYGPKHVKWLLTKNPIKIAFRNAYHVLYKLFIEGI